MMSSKKPIGGLGPEWVSEDWVPESWTRDGRQIVQRDAKGRFLSGCSGNYNGRPVADERAYSLRQSRKDLLEATEAERVYKTASGPRRLKVIKAIFASMTQKAVSGHGATARFLIRERDKAFRDLEKDNRALMERLAWLENEYRELHTNENNQWNKRSNKKFLNAARRKTRDI